MRYLTTATMVALSVVATPAAAMTLRDGQSYVSVQGGFNQAEDHSFSASGARVKTELNDGYVVIGAVGRKAGPLRMEVEGSFRHNEVESHRTTGPALAGSEGEATVLAGMANVYYDIPTSSLITPYVGGGIGVANVEFDGYRTTATGQVLDDSATTFAYQGMAGAMMPVNARMSLNAEYRYFATPKFDVRSSTQETETDYSAHSFMFGMRYAF